MYIFIHWDNIELSRTGDPEITIGFRMVAVLPWSSTTWFGVPQVLPFWTRCTAMGCWSSSSGCHGPPFRCVVFFASTKVFAFLQWFCLFSTYVWFFIVFFSLFCWPMISATNVFHTVFSPHECQKMWRTSSFPLRFISVFSPTLLIADVSQKQPERLLLRHAWEHVGSEAKPLIDLTDIEASHGIMV